MKYIVLKDFMDLEDSNHIYYAGDKYPRRGKAKQARVDVLTSTSNKRGEPLIKEAEGDS